MQAPIVVMHPGRQGVPQRVLLAHGTQQRDRAGEVLRGLPIHAKPIHQPAQGLQTIPLTWPFAVWGLDVTPKILFGFFKTFILFEEGI